MKPLEFLINFIMIFFLIASMFDLTMTISAYYHMGQSQFLSYEGNKMITWGLKHHIPIVLNPSILFNFALPLINMSFMAAYKKPKKKKNKKTYMTFIMVLTCVMVVVAGTHLVGGWSWIGL